MDCENISFLNKFTEKNVFGIRLLKRLKYCKELHALSELNRGNFLFCAMDYKCVNRYILEKSYNKSWNAHDTNGRHYLAYNSPSLLAVLKYMDLRRYHIYVLDSPRFIIKWVLNIDIPLPNEYYWRNTSFSVVNDPNI